MTPIAIAIAKIAAWAAEKQLPFLICGGHAVITHGYTRNTFDLDLAVRATDREKWSALMHELGYEFHSEGPTFMQFSPPDALTLPLDLMLMNEQAFAKLAAAAAPAPPSAGTAKSVSLPHLIAMKCHAIKHGHVGRIERDVDDVLRLVEINRLDVTQPDLREIFLRYGPKELYDKVQRTVRP